MNFADAVVNQEALTTNGMKARQSSAMANLDYFYQAPASRGQNIIPLFVAAYAENPDVALRITQWMRDVRGGAGERALFHQVLGYLEQHHSAHARAVMHKIPEIGRWDDILVFTGVLKREAFAMIAEALRNGDRLCAKWMPRQGPIAVELQTFLGWSPKRWRKTLVNLSQVVERQMCQGQWDDINFAHVPSLASARYRSAFLRHTPKFKEYVELLVRGKSTVHAAAVYPYDVLKTAHRPMNEVEVAHVVAQWEALPNLVGDAHMLPMVDVSGSMSVNISGSLTCLNVAVSLGLYLADKNTGPFKDTFLTFSSTPELLRLRGNVIQKMKQMQQSSWGMSTSIDRAFDLVLRTALAHAVAPSDMPHTVLILSDMQFNAHDHVSAGKVTAQSAFEMIATKYRLAGYAMPNLVFWNLNGSYKNVPVRYDEHGVAMVSGFSPVVLRSVLQCDFDSMQPDTVMYQAVMIDRYALPSR